MPTYDRDIIKYISQVSVLIGFVLLFVSVMANVPAYSLILFGSVMYTLLMLTKKTVNENYFEFIFSSILSVGLIVATAWALSINRMYYSDIVKGNTSEQYRTFMRIFNILLGGVFYLMGDMINCGKPANSRREKCSGGNNMIRVIILYFLTLFIFITLGTLETTMAHFTTDG
jgi:hypothetical protein